MRHKAMIATLLLGGSFASLCLPRQGLRTIEPGDRKTPALITSRFLVAASASSAI